MEIEIAEIFAKHKISVFKSDEIEGEKDLKTLFEIWHGDKKLSIYFYPTETTILRIWGPHINDEMSEHLIAKAEDVQQHIKWLMGE